MAQTIATKTAELKLGDFIKVGNDIEGYTSWTVLQLGLPHAQIMDVKIKTQDGEILVTSAHVNSKWNVVPTLTFPWSGNTLVKTEA